MMYGRIILRNLQQKALQTLLITMMTAISTALAILVLLLSSGIQEGLTKSTQPFDLIVGAKGSPNQLVMNTVFLQDTPIGNIDTAIVTQLQENPLVETAIPLGFGDNYRGYRMIGTNAAIFSHKIKSGNPDWLQLKAGRAFSKPFEAVLGAKMAKETGLQIGDSFVSSHGIVANKQADVHHESFTVVGILDTLQTPYDNGILVNLDSLYRMHEAHRGDHAVDPSPADERQQGVTAVLVKPRGYSEALQLYQQFQARQDAQLIFPAQTILQFFSLLGQGEKVLQWIAYSVISMTLFMIGCSLYWSAINRSRDYAILRAIGANRKDLARLIFGEGMVILFLGIVIGMGIGHGIFILLANVLQKQMAISIISAFGGQEIFLIAMTFFCGMVVNLLPTLQASKREIADAL